MKLSVRDSIGVPEMKGHTGEQTFWCNTGEDELTDVFFDGYLFSFFAKNETFNRVTDAVKWLVVGNADTVVTLIWIVALARLSRLWGEGVMSQTVNLGSKSKKVISTSSEIWKFGRMRKKQFEPLHCGLRGGKTETKVLFNDFLF